VLLKEAQQMKDIDRLENYIEHPLVSTIFVISHKEKTVNKTTKLGRLVKKNTELFNSEKIKDYKLVDWVTDYVKSLDFIMSQKGVLLLVDHLGNDLNRIVHELEKITINLGNRKTITEDDIEKYAGVSKEYNAFELQAAMSKKDLAKAIRIIQYFEGNPKAAPIQLILPALYGFFSKLYIIFGMADKSEAAVKPFFYNNPYAAKEALATAKMYGYDGVERALLLLHEYNLKSVGVNDSGTSDGSLLKEMVVKMMG
jgi:DNA polymerase III subunit delta